jgi:hypothetical protein
MSAGMARSGAIAPPVPGHPVPDGPAAGRPAAGPRRHVAQFYGHDDELASSLGGHLGEALAAGAAVVMIATAAHRAACAAQLAAAGADVAAATTSGAYAELDAAALARRFLAADRRDPGGFEQLIGAALRRAAGAGRPVIVYGEIVAVLWQQGLLSAVAELESWWNELGRRRSFALVCGYRAQRGGAAAFEEVGRLHSAVIGSPGIGPQDVRGFLMAGGAPRAAGQFAAATLREWGEPWGSGTFALDAAIVAMELAANAVRHARSDVTITVSRRLGAVRIAVRDSAPLTAPLTAVPGHGLGLVDSMAARWGAQPLAGRGKLVWAELAGPAA